MILLEKYLPPSTYDLNLVPWIFYPICGISPGFPQIPQYLELTTKFLPTYTY